MSGSLAPARGWFDRRRRLADPPPHLCVRRPAAGPGGRGPGVLRRRHARLDRAAAPARSAPISSASTPPGRLADAGTPALAYDQAAHYAAEQAATRAGHRLQLLLLSAGLSAAVRGTRAIALSGGVHRVPGRDAAAMPAGGAPDPAARRLGRRCCRCWRSPRCSTRSGTGQNAFLTAALFGGATLLVDRRPVMAGLLFGALCYKPHFGLLVPVALAACGPMARLSRRGSGRWQRWWRCRSWHSAGETVARLSRRRCPARMRSIEAQRLATPAWPARSVSLLVLGGTLDAGLRVQATATSGDLIALVFVVWRRGLSLPVPRRHAARGHADRGAGGDVLRPHAVRRRAGMAGACRRGTAASRHGARTAMAVLFAMAHVDRQRASRLHTSW